MATAITMPKLGLTMNSGSVQQWKKNVGDSVKKGELLYVVATDKLTVDVESPVDGVLLAISIKDNEEVPVGATIGYVGASGEKIEASAPAAASASAESSAPPSASAPLPVVPRSAESRAFAASPKAKKLARDRGIDLASLHGTGPSGWIVARDVSEAAASPSVKASPVAARMAEEAGIDIALLDTGDAGKRVMKADVAAAMASSRGTAGERRIPVTQMRRIIGERMLQSTTGIPAVNYFAEADMSAFEALRSSLNGRLAGKNPGVRISVNDILMKLCAKLLMEHPMVNASVEPDAFVLHDFVNVGFAVALDGGLLVPNVKNVHSKSLRQIAAERADLVEKARRGGLAPDEMTGGTFTVSNLGMMEIDAFTPIINPPEAAILGVGTTREKPVVREANIVIRPISVLCLSVDHRLVDGADAALFLAALKELIENPELFML